VCDKSLITYAERLKISNSGNYKMSCIHDRNLVCPAVENRQASTGIFNNTVLIIIYNIDGNITSLKIGNFDRKGKLD
jgi:hypothetical protein